MAEKNQNDNAAQTENLALYCDFENIAIGVRDARYASFDMRKVLDRLLVKGKIVVKKAYCDWERYREYKPVMHEASFELIEIPHVRQSGKNSADIRMVVDALDLCYTKLHVDTFVIISGDSDFSALVSKLRENNKVVIGVGVKNSTSDLLIANCDEFIYYDDLVRESKRRGGVKRERTGRGARKTAAAPPPEKAPTEEKATAEDKTPADDKAPPEDKAAPEEREIKEAQEALDLVVETVTHLFDERGAKDTIWGSMVKQALRRRKPGFNERYHGFRSFGKLLEEAQAQHLLDLEADEKSGDYVVKGVLQDD